MDDRHQTNRTGQDDETDRPGNEDITAPRQNTKDARFVQLFVLNEEFRVEDEGPEKRKCVEKCFQEEKKPRRCAAKLQKTSDRCEGLRSPFIQLTGLRRKIIQLKTFPNRPNVKRTTAMI